MQSISAVFCLQVFLRDLPISSMQVTRNRNDIEHVQQANLFKPTEH